MNQIRLPPATDWREEQRFLAYEFKRQGWKQRRIAEVLTVSPSTVSQWLKRAKAGGQEALRNRSRRRTNRLAER
jgi:transposase